MVVRSPPLTPVLGCAERARLGGCVLQVLEVSLGLLWFVFSSPESHYISAAVVSAGGCRVVVEFRSGSGFQNPWGLKHKQRGDAYYSVFQPHFKPEFLRMEVFFLRRTV